MKVSNYVQGALLTSIMMMPSYAIGADNSSKLTNQSKQNGSAGYYLEQEKIIAENDCVKVDGNKKLNPGDSAQLNVKQECKWGVVKYKIYNMDDKKEMGTLAHSFHDGDFSIEITSVCTGKDCNFTSLNPAQDNANKGNVKY